jgi:hypothetical protein
MEKKFYEASADLAGKPYNHSLFIKRDFSVFASDLETLYAQLPEIAEKFRKELAAQ